MQAFDVAKLPKMNLGDYILYQISKSKKYDMELIEEEAERRKRNIIRLYFNGFMPLQISELLDIPLDTFNAIAKRK